MTNQINIHQYPVGPMDNFIYLMECAHTKQIAVVDPAWDFPLIQSEINRLNGQLSMVLLTHCHFDHLNALEDVLNHYDIPVYVSNQSQTELINDLPQTQLVGEFDTISFGAHTINILTTPGHSICGQCFFVDDHLITGDTMFINGCGRADLGDSSPQALYQSLEKIKALPDDTVIYCGHNYADQSTDTLGNQKKTNPYLLCKDEATFVRKRMGFKS
tara:strand:+ start:2190 stop:2837 length:648 start_codon:yes stop_codon:yes gene_type:complete